MKIIKFLTIFFVLNLNFAQAAEIDYGQQVKMFEACADDKFKNYYGSSYYEDFIKTSLKNKLMTSQPYEWLYEDCETQSHSKPITFKLKNKLYEQDPDYDTQYGSPFVFRRNGYATEAFERGIPVYDKRYKQYPWAYSYNNNNTPK